MAGGKKYGSAGIPPWEDYVDENTAPRAPAVPNARTIPAKAAKSFVSSSASKSAESQPESLRRSSVTSDKQTSVNAADVPPWIAVDGEKDFDALEIPPSAPQTVALISAAEPDGPKTSPSRTSPDPLVASLDAYDIDDPLEEAIWAVYAPSGASLPSVCRTSSGISSRTPKHLSSGVHYDPAEHSAPWEESPTEAGVAVDVAARAPHAPEKGHARARATVPGTDPDADPTEAPSKVFAKKPDPAHASTSEPMPSSPRLGHAAHAELSAFATDKTEAAPRSLTKEEEHRAEVLRFWAALELFSPPGFSEISTERSAVCRWRPGASDVRSLEARAFWEGEFWPEGTVQIDTKALPREEVRGAVPYFTVYLGIVPLRTLFSHVLRVLEVPLGSSRPADDALYQPGAARRGVLAENPGLEPVLAEASNIRGTAFLACFELNPWGKLVPDSFRLSDIVSALSLAVRKKRGAAELRRRGERVPKDFFAVPFTIEDAARRNGFYAEHFLEYARKTLGTDSPHPGYKRTIDRDGVVTITDPQEDAKHATADFIEYVSSRIASWIGWGEVFDCAVRITKHDARWEPAVEDGECLGSFYLRDLRRLLRLAEAGEPLGKPLETLLGRASRPEERHDLLREAATVKAALNPERFPLGRWPSDASHHLYAAQQAAVNIVCAPLGRGTEFGKKGGEEGASPSLPVSVDFHPSLLSLNGPPGTGKSWLLRDVIADIVVARAEALAELEQSSDVFDSTRSVTGETNGGPIDIRPVRSDLTAPFTIVVASNNNAAIRNITDTLPRSFSLSRRRIDPRTGRETKSAPFGYWRDTALKMLRGLEFLNGGTAPGGNRTARAGVDPTSAAAGTLEKSVWGLVSATLGRRANCKRFALDVLTTAKPAPEALPAEGRDPMAPSAANDTNTHTARKFHAEGRDEAEDPDGKHLDQPLHEDEEHILASREERRQHFLGATLTRQLRNCKTDRGRDEKHRENVRREEGREEVVRDHRLHVCEIALFGHGRGRGRTVGKSHVRRTEKKVETRGKQRGENRRQERIEDRVTEDPTRFARLRDRSKGRNDRNRDDRDADELEKFDENRGDEVADGVRERRAVKAVHHAEHDGCEVEAGHDQLLALGFGRECGSSVDGHDEFPSLVGMSTVPPGAEYGRDSEKSE